MAKTYQDYFDATKQNIYGSKKLQAPEAELYVIYVGNKKIDKNIISLSEEFYSGKQTAIDVRVNVIVESKENDIVNQYILFCKVVNSLLEEKGRSIETLREAIRICKNQNILKDYLESHEEEAVDIMMDLFYQGKNTDRMLASEHIETLLESVKNLMDSLGLTFEQATSALKLSGADKENLRIRM